MWSKVNTANGEASLHSPTIQRFPKPGSQNPSPAGAQLRMHSSSPVGICMSTDEEKGRTREA